MYRARLNFDCNKNPIELFKHTDDLWAPPIECVKYDGRCNLRNESILYCSISRQGAIYEVKPRLGDFVSIIKYSLAEEINPFALVGFKRIVSYNSSYTTAFRDHFKDVDNKIISLDEYLAEVFLRDHSDDVPIYNLTNAVFQTYTYRPINNYSQIKGILYPSVQSDELNFAFIPELVRSLFKPYWVELFQVIAEDDSKFVVEKTYQTDVLNKEGELVWNKYPHPYIVNIDKVVKNY